RAAARTADGLRPPARSSCACPGSHGDRSEEVPAATGGSPRQRAPPGLTHATFRPDADWPVSDAGTPESCWNPIPRCDRSGEAAGVAGAAHTALRETYCYRDPPTGGRRSRSRAADDRSTAREVRARPEMFAAAVPGRPARLLHAREPPQWLRLAPARETVSEV